MRGNQKQKNKAKENLFKKIDWISLHANYLKLQTA